MTSALFLRSLGWPEIVLIIVALMLIFGASRLPKMGASLGQSLRAFKGALTGQDQEEDAESKDKKEVKSNAKEKEQA